jgi:hypothetical protein
MEEAMNPEKESASTSVVVPILGMHRSGTSMFARALNLLGLELGQPLLPPQPDNLRGFWENEFFLSIDVRLLRGLGNHPSGYGSAKDLGLLPGRSASIVPSQEELATIDSYVSSAFRKASVWGWKDPRTVPLFPFWLHTLVQLGFDDIRPTIIVRHPGQCVRSLVKRGDMDGLASALGVSVTALATDIWKAYHRILAAISDETGCMIAVHGWFLDAHKAESELARSAAYCGLSTEGMTAAVEWIDPTPVEADSHRADEGEGIDAESQALYWDLVARAERQKSEWMGGNGGTEAAVGG